MAQIHFSLNNLMPMTHTQTLDIPVMLTTTVTQPTKLIWFSVQNDLFQTSEDPLEVHISFSFSAEAWERG